VYERRCMRVYERGGRVDVPQRLLHAVLFIIIIYIIHIL
jgi:hypothetical protein